MLPRKNEHEFVKPPSPLPHMGRTGSINLLLAADAKHNIESKKGNPSTSLHLAVLNGNSRAVKSLLNEGANPNHKTHQGKTLLHLAAEKGNIEIAQLLLTGADPNVKDDEGLTPLDLAVYGNHLNVSSLLDGFEQNMYSCLVQRMRALGFEIDTICFGFSETAKLYALSGENELNHFYNTLFFLKGIKVKNLVRMQEKYKYVYDQLYKQAKQEAIEELGFKERALDEKRIIRLRQATHDRLVLLRKQLSVEDQKNADQFLNVLALFNGIELEHQGSEKHHALFNKHDLILLEKKNFEKDNPQRSELLITPGNDHSLLYKIKSDDGSFKNDVITLEELKMELQDQYKPFTHFLRNKIQPSLRQFFPSFLNIISKKGDFLQGNKITLQFENSSWVTPVIQPHALEKKGGETQLALFTGSYKREEFPDYFKILRNKLKEKKINDPVILSLSFSDHAISIMFDPIADTWRIFEIYKMPYNQDELKQHVFPGTTNISEKIADDLFSKEGNILIKTIVSTTNEAEKRVKPAIDAWLEDLTPLHEVTKEKASLNDKGGFSWLHIAAQAGDVKKIKELLSHNANINNKYKGNTALHFAAARGLIESVVILLSDQKLKPNEINEASCTALYIAATFGHTDIVKILLESKLEERINPNLIAKEGETPLMIAIEQGYNNIVELLLKVETINFGSVHDIWNPLFLAVDVNDIHIIRMLLTRSQEIDPNLLCKKTGTNALHIAIKKGHLEIVHLLLSVTFKTKINVNLKTSDKTDSSPLYLAAAKGYVKIVKRLLALGADVNASVSGQRTPVFVAAQKGLAKVVKTLAEAKANLNFPNENGVTPLMVAVKNGYADIVDVLLATEKVDIDSTVIDIALKEGRTDIAERLSEAHKRFLKAHKIGNICYSFGEEIGSETEDSYRYKRPKIS
jgi:ankyrin repeat protein